MWHILNYVPPPGIRRSMLPGVIESFDARLELFAPTFVSIASEGGKVKKTEKPLLYHYIFVRGDEADIKRLCATRRGFSFVIDRSGDEPRHLTVADDIMERFMLIARFYGNKLPCYPLADINLEEGDKVQIVSGDCAGLTGTYISRKGGKNGNVLIAIDSALAAIVYDVRADYVRVLEFARDSRRLYDQLDAFTLRLLSTHSSLLPTHSSLLSTPPLSLIAASTVFVRRLGVLKVKNPKLEARLRILLYAAYTILGDKTCADDALARYESLSQHITNPWTRALSLWILRRPSEALALLPKEEKKLSEIQSLLLASLTSETSR